jgi:hypothetical protein
MRDRHEDIEAQRHEVVAKAKRDQVQRTHVRTRSLPAWSPLRAHVPEPVLSAVEGAQSKGASVPSSPPPPSCSSQHQTAQSDRANAGRLGDRRPRAPAVIPRILGIPRVKSTHI